MRELDAKWNLIEQSYDSDLSKHYEGLFTQGNGYIHVRGSYEEGLIDSKQDREYDRKPANVTLEKHEKEKTKWGTYIPGVVGKHPLLMTEMINLPYIFELKFVINGQRLDMDESDITSYTRWLSLKDGVLYREMEYAGSDAVRLAFCYSRFVSKSSKHIAIQRVEIKCLAGEASIEVEGGMNSGVRTNGFEHYLGRGLEADANKAFAEIKTNGGNTVSMLSRLSIVKGAAEVSSALTGAANSSRAYQKGTVNLACGEGVVVEKRIAFATDRDLNETGNPAARGEQYLEEACKKSYEQLYAEHEAAWSQEWQAADIKVEGDEKVQQASRMSIYHLLRCKPADDYRIAICAKGYAGEAYFGRYFWDTEMSMLPFFLHTDAKAAKNLIRFRYETLDGARRNAVNYGYTGARYPWESSVDGEEECANWQYADHEIHVTADVVYAMMHYVKATGDLDFLKDFGAEIMVETARYWCQRVDWDKDGVCHLLGVMGPDEYLPMTRDNTYTNNMVIYSLKETLHTLDWMKNSHKESYDALVQKVSLKDSEMAEFVRVAGALIKGYDEKSEVILQSQDFMSYADIDLNEIWTDRSKYFGQLISQEKNYRSKALKQADLLELILLFRDSFSDRQLEANYDYYEPITTHDSSLSAAVHGILCSWMGRDAAAMEFLDRVISIDMAPEKKGAEAGIHIANCGGIWQMLIYGFAGLKSAMSSEELALEPHLPKEIKSMEFPLTWRGNAYRIFVDHSGYDIKKM
ncbi:glycosyl hydrolase family 65 protein [Roseburia hominis]